MGLSNLFTTLFFLIAKNYKDALRILLNKNC